jgi:hypothetical protein
VASARSLEVSCREIMDPVALRAMVAASGASPDFAARINQAIDAFLRLATRWAPLGSRSWFFRIHDTMLADLPSAAAALRLMGECEPDPNRAAWLLKKAHFAGVCAESVDASLRNDWPAVVAKQAEMDVLLAESFGDAPDQRERLRAYRAVSQPVQTAYAKMHREMDPDFFG